jgi:DNA-binding NarL/FixJ family response regulator
MAAMPLRVMLIEDHAIVRETLQDFIGRLPQVSVCHVAANAEAALAALDDATPNLLLVDLSLPGMSGIDFVREVRERNPEMRCLILSGHGSHAYVRQALAAGADGYMLKGDPLEIERGILAMTRGERYVSSGLEELTH